MVREYYFFWEPDVTHIVDKYQLFSVILESNFSAIHSGQTTFAIDPNHKKIVSVLGQDVRALDSVSIVKSFDMFICYVKFWDQKIKKSDYSQQKSVEKMSATRQVNYNSYASQLDTQR